MNWREILGIGVYSTAIIVAAAAFIAAMRSHVTVDSPSGEAGLHAPVIALSVAAMVAAEVFGVGTGLFRWLRAIGIGIGSWLSAYLWMSEAAKVHPSDLRLLIDLSLVWILAGVLSLILMPILIAVIVSYRESDN